MRLRGAFGLLMAHLLGGGVRPLHPRHARKCATPRDPALARRFRDAARAAAENRKARKARVKAARREHRTCRLERSA